MHTDQGSKPKGLHNATSPRNNNLLDSLEADIDQVLVQLDNDQYNAETIPSSNTNVEQEEAPGPAPNAPRLSALGEMLQQGADAQPAAIKQFLKMASEQEERERQEKAQATAKLTEPQASLVEDLPDVPDILTIHHPTDDDYDSGYKRHQAQAATNVGLQTRQTDFYVPKNMDTPPNEHEENKKESRSQDPLSSVPQNLAENDTERRSEPLSPYSPTSRHRNSHLQTVPVHVPTVPPTSERNSEYIIEKQVLHTGYGQTPSAEKTSCEKPSSEGTGLCCCIRTLGVSAILLAAILASFAIAVVFQDEVGGLMDELYQWSSTTIKEMELAEHATMVWNEMKTMLWQVMVAVEGLLVTVPAPALLYTPPTCPVTPRTSCPVPIWVMPNSYTDHSDDAPFEYTRYTPGRPRQNSWFASVLLLGAAYHVLSSFLGSQKWQVWSVDPRKLARSWKWILQVASKDSVKSPRRRRPRRPFVRRSTREQRINSPAATRNLYALSPRRSSRLAKKR